MDIQKKPIAELGGCAPTRVSLATEADLGTAEPSSPSSAVGVTLARRHFFRADSGGTVDRGVVPVAVASYRGVDVIVEYSADLPFVPFVEIKEACRVWRAMRDHRHVFAADSTGGLRVLVESPVAVR